MAEHYVERCACGVIIAQCRCASTSKTVRVGVCAVCRVKQPPSPADRLYAICSRLRWLIVNDGRTYQSNPGFEADLTKLSADLDRAVADAHPARPGARGAAQVGGEDCGRALAVCDVGGTLPGEIIARALRDRGGEVVAVPPQGPKATLPPRPEELAAQDEHAQLTPCCSALPEDLPLIGPTCSRCGQAVR